MWQWNSVWPPRPYTEPSEEPEEPRQCYGEHEWIDTGGMLRSYCRRCDCKGNWDHKKQVYVEVD
jgi:hypothetical protein